MKVALIGATGMAGARILTELIARGHQVSAVVRSPEKVAAHPQVQAYKADINEPQSLIAILKQHDAVISAVHFLEMQIEQLLAALTAAQVPRYLMVGGAGGLFTKDGQRLVDSAGFPDSVKPEALAGIAILDTLREQQQLQWTVLSPSMVFKPATRSGQFRLGLDELLVSADGSSFISAEDYAIALVDELEQPQHLQQRFTVGY
jgi:putative NADH-flavin reductase